MSFYGLKDKAFAEIKKRRQQAIADLNDRIDELCLDSAFAEAYTAERTAEAELEKARFYKKPLEGFEKDLQRAQKNTDVLLKKLGKNRRDLTVKYFCDKCSDTGRVDGNICSCVDELQSKLAYDGRQSVARFCFEQNEETEEANQKLISKAEAWCQNFGNKKDKTNFLILGHAGVGKTFLCDCIVNALIKRGINAVYLTAYNLNKIFFDDFMSTEKYLLDNLTKVSVLVIDDLGKEPIYNKISLESLYCLLNERLLNGKSTVINTNLDAQKLLTRYGEPIFSRMTDKQTTLLMELKGKDKRKKTINKG